MDTQKLKMLLRYDPETGVFTRLTKWGSKQIGDEAGSISPQGYRQIGLMGKTYVGHRLAWLYVYGKWPDGDIDHVNRNRADNRIDNLRDVPRSKNLHNSGARLHSQTKIKGVSLVSLRRGKRPKKLWRADISFNGKRTFLGAFYTIEEATAARKKAEIDLL